jgi:glycerol-3-phosphate O-acyltransferase/dihydroxyacetone phosphate acyltransferase
MLVRLKTGTARIVLRAAAEKPELPVAIVPCGLVYLSQTRFRSRVLVQFGAPIEIDAQILELHARAPNDAVTALTAHLDRALRELLVNADDWETIRMLDTVRRFFQPAKLPLERRVEVARRFSQIYATLQDHPEVQVLRQRVTHYQARLRELGLRDADLADAATLTQTLAKAARQSALFVVWTIAGLPGAVMHAPMLMFAKGAERWLAKGHGDMRATIKVVAAMVATLVLDLMFLAWIVWYVGWWPMIATLVVLPFLGIATLNLLDRQLHFRRLWQSIVRIAAHRRGVYELRAERVALQEAIAQCVLREIPEAGSALAPIHAP